jgi:HPt (histidine-containing phosphotransfer) domain-containing protein
MSHSDLSNPAKEAPAVDFLSLLGRCLGNFKIVELVIATFRDTGKSDLNQLQMAVVVGDYPAVVEIAHRFKGAASNVSATGLAKLLVHAELFGREQNHSELMRIVAELQSEWEAFLKFAQVFAPAATTAKPRTAMQCQETSETRHARAGC